MKPTMPNAAKSGRQCHTCTACCIDLEIDSKPGFSTTLDTGEDIAKSAGTPCKFLGTTGCNNYENRPLLCRQFKCDWLIGRAGYEEDDNPQNIGHIGVRGNPMPVPYNRFNKTA